MAIINNSELKKNLIEGAKINIVTDAVPSELGKTVVPVMEVNPRLLKITGILGQVQNKSTTASGVNLTLGNVKNMFVTALEVSNTQNATCDNVLINVSATIGGKSNTVFYSRVKQTTTAQSTRDFVQFNPPLRIDSGNVFFNAVFTAGTSVTNLTLFGYSEEK